MSWLGKEGRMVQALETAVREIMGNFTKRRRELAWEENKWWELGLQRGKGVIKPMLRGVLRDVNLSWEGGGGLQEGNVSVFSHVPTSLCSIYSWSFSVSWEADLWGCVPGLLVLWFLIGLNNRRQKQEIRGRRDTKVLVVFPRPLSHIMVVWQYRVVWLQLLSGGSSCVTQDFSGFC